MINVGNIPKWIWIIDCWWIELKYSQKLATHRSYIIDIRIGVQHFSLQRFYRLHTCTNALQRHTRSKTNHTLPCTQLKYIDSKQIFSLLHLHTLLKIIHAIQFSGIENFGHGRLVLYVRRWKNFVQQFGWKIQCTAEGLNESVTYCSVRRQIELCELKGKTAAM